MSEAITKALQELVSIVDIHQRATGNNFAWAEMDEAKATISQAGQGGQGEAVAWQLTDDEVTLCHSNAVLAKKHDGTDPSFTTLLSREIHAAIAAKLYAAQPDPVPAPASLHVGEMTVPALRNALALAANRMDRMILDLPPGTMIRRDAETWVEEARAVLALRPSPAPVASAVGGDTGSEVLRQVFALCEATEEAELPTSSVDSQAAQDFMRGRKFEAKQIRRAIGTWFQDEFCGRSFMGEPVGQQPAPAVPADAYAALDHCVRVLEKVHADIMINDGMPGVGLLTALKSARALLSAAPKPAGKEGV